MLKNYASVILLSICVQVSVAQQMPIDFADNQDVFIPFAGSDFALTVDPQNSNDEAKSATKSSGFDQM